MERVGVYLGSNKDDVSNIQNVLETWVKALSGAGLEVDLVGGNKIPDFIRDKATVYSVPAPTLPTPFSKIIYSYRHISTYITNQEPDVVIQLWKYQTHAAGVAIAGKLYDVPSVIRFTGDIFQEYRGYDFPKSAGIFLLANVIGSVPLIIGNGVVVLGPNLKEIVLSRGRDESDVHLIPPPQPKKEKFYPVSRQKAVRASLGINEDSKVALFVGRLTKQKGMAFLQKVIEGTLSKTDIQFVLVGEGPYQEEFRDHFSDEEVLLPGYVPPCKIAKYYQAASVYIHPSRFEGIPLVILEALQSGVPVVAREAGDVGFVIQDVVTTEQQMIDRLVQGEWNKRWQNKIYFTPEFQRKVIVNLIDDLAQ